MGIRQVIRSRRWHALRGALLIGAGMLAPTLARAHFILITPDSWMSQDALGFPEKLGPCGDEGGGTPTGTVTAFRPGETIVVTISEVVPHPGHYRVALAVNDRSELPAEPPVTPTATDPCGSAAIQSPPIFPILADNMLPHTAAFEAPQAFAVTLPADVTCDKCTLQVLEFMSHHGTPCFYHHCAEISIHGEGPACGDGTIQAGEQCDDGNRDGEDGCAPDCTIEAGFVCSGQPSACTSLPAPTATPVVCAGDCDAGGDVTINELVALVNIVLGNAPAAACPNGVPDGAAVDIALINRAVNTALYGCGG